MNLDRRFGSWILRIPRIPRSENPGPSATLRTGLGTQQLFAEKRLEVLPAVEDAENGYDFAGNFESDADAPPEAEDTQTGTDIIPPRAPHGKGLQALALLHNRIGVAGGNLGRSCRSRQ